MNRRIAHAAQITAVVLALVLVPAALAGKGGSNPSSGSSALTLVLAKDQNANGAPNYGDTVTFNISTTATDRPYVSLSCTQNGTVVYAASAGFFAGYLWPWEQNFTLSSTYWTGGAADCTATLYYYDGRRTRDLASRSFPVAA